MTALPKTKLQKKAVLYKAYMNLGLSLGLTQAELASIVGRDRSSLQRGGIDPDSKTGESALLMLRAYRGLKAIMGNDENAKHWFNTPNRAFDAKPRDMVKSLEGLVTVVQYLDAHRGKN